MCILTVNMTDQRIHKPETPQAFAAKGGRGLTSLLVHRDVPPGCDPLGPENKLVYAPGLLTGTPLVNTGRLSVGAKSPLTGGIKESNAGGTMAVALARQGIKALMVEGKASGNELFILRIDKTGQASLISAQEYRGMGTYDFVGKMLAIHGPDTAVLCIGPAGEMQATAASIQSSDTDGRPCRAAGRGGLGAVMGAKGLKAIVVHRGGRQKPRIADPVKFRKASKAFAAAVKENPLSGQLMPAFGTPALVAPVNAMGAFPCFNATRGAMPGWEKISGEAMADIVTQRGGLNTHRGCAQCIVHCSNVYNDPDGNYVTGSLEFETIWSMGGMTGIDDLDTIARLDFLCDDLGVDTMDIGVAMGVAMDAGYKNFGDPSAALEMMAEISRATEFGKTLSNGAVAVGKYFKHHRVPAVKGQSIAAYDPRAMQGNGVTYATSPMGADHTAGNVIGEYMSGALDPLQPDGQVSASRAAQIAMATIDCLGLCLFASFALGSPEGGQALLDAVCACLGTELGQDAMNDMGVQVLKTERAFNTAAGFTNQDDRLPEFFYKEPLPPHNQVVRVTGDQMDSLFKEI